MTDSAPNGAAVDAALPIAFDPAWTESPLPGAEDAAIERVLLSSDRLAARVAALGAAITGDYAPLLNGGRLVVAVTLRGATLFGADLVRAIALPLELDFISTSSYGDGTTSSGAVRFLKDLETDITGRHVLIVEDILDTGLTLAKLVEELAVRNPASLRICALLDKGREVALRKHSALAYTGFLIPDEFVVGYGLDYAQRYRNLPYVGVLKPEVYNSARE